MTTQISEARNNRFKLAHHRLVARALERSPGLKDEALDVVRAWRMVSDPPKFVDDWHYILSQPVETVRREIVKRSADWDRLRNSSPFALTRTKLLDAESTARLRRKIK